jgi:hypothetical protein
MLTETATIKIKIDDAERDISVTPLFLQNHAEPWDPNEIFELEELGNNNSGTYLKFDKPVEIGKIIVNDQKEWRYEGEDGIGEEMLRQLAEFVLTYNEAP